MNKKTTLLLAGLLIVAAGVRAQAPENSGEDAFVRAAGSVQGKLEAGIAELNRLREQAAEEKIPLSRKLSELESELVDVRLEYQQTTRLLDSRILDQSNLRTEIKSRQEEANYLSNLFGEYIRNFESRLHIAEIQRYRDRLETARLASENTALSEQEIHTAQVALLSVSLERLTDAIGGTSFNGTAVDPDGIVKSGTFVLVGPTAIFRSLDGQAVGAVEQRLGSLEPAIVPFADPADAGAASAVIAAGAGTLPFDPTLGNAHKIEQTEETLLEHIRKGGPVMVPIFALAGAALLVALFKWLGLFFIRTPSRKRLNALLDAVARHDRREAHDRAKAIGGPVGRMLTAGVEHLKEPRELIEEVMYEEVLTTRLKLERLLPFIAISAAAAPLLGLLGTVTGIISTFKLITIFGSGDVKTLSGGISEALITTEFGLIVAIPSLLIHALLSRKARGVVNQMEKAAVALINQISKTPYKDANIVAEGEPSADASAPRERKAPVPKPESEPDAESDPEPARPTARLREAHADREAIERQRRLAEANQPVAP
jgi:biopolymer transport protein ExbB